MSSKTQRNAGRDPVKQALARGIALHREGRMEEAERHYLALLQRSPDFAGGHHALGFLYYQWGRLERACQSLRRSVQLKARNAPAWNELGNALRDLGHMDEAVAAYRRAVKLEPDFALAHCALAQLRDHGEPDEHEEEYRALKQAYARSRRNTPERRDLAWGMARAAEQRGEPGAAMDYLAEAHRIQRSERGFDLEATGRYLAAVREVFSREFVEQRADWGDDTRLPVFVLGLPRSGTSLVEQILASHSAVFGAGELREVGNLCGQLERRSGRIFAAAFGGLEPPAVRRLARDCEARLRALAPRARRVVDKMPANFLCLGMLAILFPWATFIHCRRDPVATCWSLYSTRFAEPHPFADDLSDLGGYYRLYREHMAHWEAVLPGRIHHCDYEALVADPEARIPALLEAAGLAMEPACLRFHETRRAVGTASARQVRQPIYRDALDRAVPFEPYLGPLREALGDTA